MMELLLKRIARRNGYTIGKLYVNGKYICDTCEDQDRFFYGKPKIKGETAIPCGRYEVVQNVFSNRFGNRAFYKNLCGGYVPRLLKVPMFDGVLIHTGNTAQDSSGCIIVGKNKVVGKVLESRETFKKLMVEYLLPAKRKGEKVYITIV
jgi:hypothetical protein